MSTDLQTPVIMRPVTFLAAVLTLGALGDYLFSSGRLGINVLFWVGTLAAVLIALSVALRVPLRGEGRWMLAPALLFAGFVAWRASPVMQAINVGSMVAILAIASFRLKEGRVRFGAVTEYLWLGVLGAVAIYTGGFRLARRHVRWPVARRTNSYRMALPLVRGLAIGIPLVVVFGALFAAADTVFADGVASVLRFDLWSFAAHLLRTALWGWLSAGVIYGALVGRVATVPEVAPAARFRLGPIEVSTVLGLLDVLFLLFVAIQAKYLFGGSGHVQVTDGLTYAEYARHGFFELLAVAALVLPVVLGVHWLLRDSSPVLRIAFRILAATLVLLVFAVIASALQRMRVYVDEYGLTQLRLYTSAVMIWLAVVFAWLLATVLRERRQRFAFGALGSGMLVVAGLNVLNPDAFIVDTNTDRSVRREFDATYAASLSADATPTLIAGLARMTPEARCEVAVSLASDLREQGGWQSWNYGRTASTNAIRDAADELSAACRPD